MSFGHKNSNVIIFGLMVLVFVYTFARDLRFKYNNYGYWSNERENLGFELTTIKDVVERYDAGLPHVIYQSYDPGSRILLPGYNVYPENDLVIFLNASPRYTDRYRIAECFKDSSHCHKKTYLLEGKNIGNLKPSDDGEAFELFTKSKIYDYRELQVDVQKYQLLEVHKADGEGFNVVGRILYD